MLSPCANSGETTSARAVHEQFSGTLVLTRLMVPGAKSVGGPGDLDDGLLVDGDIFGVG